MRKPSETAQPSVAELAAKFINQTDRSIFLTGKAGTGKTTFLKQIIQETHKRAIIVAPTGIAAINAGGVTIHSQFQLPFGAFIPTDDLPFDLPASVSLHTPQSLRQQMRLPAFKRHVLSRLELLIIDEVSMLRADLLDAVDAILRIVRHAQFTPFGGVQVLFIGDLMQLPPVVKHDEWEVLRHYYKSPFFFDAAVLSENKPLYIELDKIYRQADPVFIGILNNLRHNRITESDLVILNQFYKPDFKPKPDEGYIHLTTHNAKAAELNETTLSALQGKEYAFEAEVTDDFPELIYPTDKTLRLKIGAQIMFIKNDISGEQRFFNGKIARVEKIELVDGSYEITVKFDDSATRLVLEKYEWKNIRFQVNEQTKAIEEEVIGVFRHYPVKLAWAITVHKSQGLTFEKAVIDVGSAFASGQIYVALSRLTSLRGLVLTAQIAFRGISNDAQVERYAATKPDFQTIEQALETETLFFIRHSILKAYNFSRLAYVLRQHVESYNKSESHSEKQKHYGWASAQYDKIPPLSIHAQKFTQELRARLDAKPIDWQELLKRLESARTYFIEKFGAQMLDMFVHKEQISIIPKTKAYVEELVELEMLVFEQYQQFHKVVLLVKCLVEKIPITKTVFDTSPAIKERYELLQSARRAVSKTSPNPPIETVMSKTVSKKAKAQKTPRFSKLGLSETLEKTYELFQNGKTLSEIAAERGMSLGTIYDHLTRIVSKGLIDVREIIDEERLETIFEAFSGVDLGNSVREVKEKLGDDYLWEEIRLARAAQVYWLSQ
jgi:hypothetical protein